MKGGSSTGQSLKKVAQKGMRVMVKMRLKLWWWLLLLMVIEKGVMPRQIAPTAFICFTRSVLIFLHHQIVLLLILRLVNLLLDHLEAVNLRGHRLVDLLSQRGNSPQLVEVKKCIYQQLK